jgi:proline dehydrogenase
MQLESNISFDDTSVAFEPKSNKALKKANFLFSVVSNPVMSSLSTTSVKIGLALGLPIKGIIKNTVFEHFCGGETINESQKTIDELGAYHVGTILDYSVEGEDEEAAFDKTRDEIIKTVEFASKSKDVPFSVFKVTGLAHSDILVKINAKETLSDEESVSFEKVRERVNAICSKAHDLNVPILIDSEETWMQGPIDQMAYEMMKKYNNERCIVYNTYQMYRTDTLGSIKRAFHYAALDNYYLGAKLVRGAYMEKERERALEQGYSSPIQPTKEATDENFNNGLAFCIDNKQRISLVCGSHNEYSNYYLALLMEKHSMKNNDQRVWFAQLYGMSDNISFNLAKANYNVAKYVPYGPVKSVMPYLLRRASENTSVAGQSSRELSLIRKELNRRKSLS